MSTLVSCPTCQTKLQINPEQAAQVMRCPRCFHNFRLAAAPTVHSVPPAATQATPKAPLRPTPKPTPKAAPRAAPKISSKGTPRAAPKAPPRPPAAAVRRPPSPPTTNTNRTILGQATAALPRVSMPPPCVAPPPLNPTPSAASASRKGGLLRWVFLGCLLTCLLGGGGFAAFYFWKAPAKASQTEEGDLSTVFGKWGVIEIGSKGIKTFVLDVFESEDKEDFDFNLVWKDKANPNLVAIGKDELSFTPQALDAAESHIKKFHETMRDKHGLSQERIFVVSSSGLWVPFAKNADARAKNKKTLADRVKAATDLPLYEITALDEARLGMKTCVPRKDLPAAVFLDIGSGNTKGGYFASRDVFEGTDVKLGSVTFTDKVKAEAKRGGKPFTEQAAALRETALEQPLREEIERVPGLAQQRKIHLAGGAVWALVAFTHPSESKSRLELTAADVERFAVLVRKPPDTVRNEVLAQVKDAGQWKKASKEIGEVQKTFGPENLQAQAEILKALANVYNFKDKQLFFFRNSHIAWPMGFVLERGKVRN